MSTAMVERVLELVARIPPHAPQPTRVGRAECDVSPGPAVICAPSA